MSQETRPGTDTAAVAAALVTVTLWASAFVGIRAVASQLSPGSLALGRMAIGAAVLGLFLARRGFIWPSRRDLGLIVGAGVVWFAFYQVALNAAERSVDAGTAAMLVNIGPIFIALLAGTFLGEGLPGRLVVGCAVAFAGAVLIGLATSSGSTTGGATLGIVLCIASAAAYAIGVTLQKPVLRRVSALEVTWLACLVGALACLPFGPLLVGELGRADATAIGWLVYLGVFPTAVGFTTWSFALSRTTAGRLGSTTYLVPPIAIVLGWVILAEVPPALAIAGGALCIGGVVIARTSRLPLVGRIRRTVEAG